MIQAKWRVNLLPIGFPLRCAALSALLGAGSWLG